MVVRSSKGVRITGPSIKLQSFPSFKVCQTCGNVTLSSKNWFGPVKGYSLLDQVTSRNLSTKTESKSDEN
jgi:hypothetical protein